MERSARQIVNDNGRILFAKFFQQRIPLKSFLVQIPTNELWGDSNIYCHHQFRSRTKWLQQQSQTNFLWKYFPTVPGLILVIIGPGLGWSEAVWNARIIVWGSGILGSGLAGLVGKGDPGNRSEWGGASSDNYGSSSNSWELAWLPPSLSISSSIWTGWGWRFRRVDDDILDKRRWVFQGSCTARTRIIRHRAPLLPRLALGLSLPYRLSKHCASKKDYDTAYENLDGLNK